MTVIIVVKEWTF